jgi:hypothetical protein
MKQRLPFIAVGILVLIAGALYVSYGTVIQPGGGQNTEEEVFCTMDAKMCPDGSYVGRTGPKCEFAPCPSASIQTYSNDTYGISFSYPDYYLVTERELGNGERDHFSLTLMQKGDANIPPNSDGPAVISLDIYQNNLDTLGIERWLKEHNASNFKLSNGQYQTFELEGRPAVSYHWSGLYEAEAVAFEHAGNIVAVSGQYISPEDQILKDYQNLIQSIRLR